MKKNRDFLSKSDANSQNDSIDIDYVTSAPTPQSKLDYIGVPGGSMIHDVVVGGGHTIEVQKEEGSQISDLAVYSDSVTPNADGTAGGAGHGKTTNADGTVSVSKPKYSAKNETDKSLSEPLRDNLGSGSPDRHIGLPSAAGKQARSNAKEPLRDNFGQVPPCVNSVYGNADTGRRTYGDFKSGKNQSSGDSDNKSKESDQGKEAKESEKDRAVTVKSGKKLIKTIVIAGQIEGHSQLPQEQKATRYEELIPQLVEIEENDEISGLLLILNTVGGDVEAGLALSELIAGMKKPTASLVLGGGHSIGVPLAVSAKRSFIAPSATMTLHPVRVNGMVLSAPQTYVYLNNMQERIIDFVCSHSSISSDRFYELMLAREEMSTDLGSVLDGKKAVEEGIIDQIGTLHEALEFLSSEF